LEFSFDREFGGKNALAGGRFNPTPALLIYTDFPGMMTPIESLPRIAKGLRNASERSEPEMVASADGAFSGRTR
jgi:hypothetical protein